MSLKDFINNRMKMSHVYQPVMLKVLLQQNGQATIDEIAKSLLLYDQSQIDYYGLRTKSLVGKVLTNNDVVEPIKQGRSLVGYRLVQDDITEAERASLVALCDQHINDYTPLTAKSERFDVR